MNLHISQWHGLVASAEPSKAKPDHYREWSRDEILKTVKGKDDEEMSNFLVAGGVIAVVVVIAIAISWIRD